MRKLTVFLPFLVHQKSHSPCNKLNSLINILSGKLNIQLLNDCVCIVLVPPLHMPCYVHIWFRHTTLNLHIDSTFEAHTVTLAVYFDPWTSQRSIIYSLTIWYATERDKTWININITISCIWYVQFHHRGRNWHQCFLQLSPPPFPPG